MTRSVIVDEPIPDFPLPYPTGYRPARGHNAWERACVLYEHVGLGVMNPMARIATISRMARVFADYDRLERDCR